ncbi:MarR family winged helix-turn-helix transcriptional regulator [Neisseria sp.]|uniref:MarR family winged helix-turn-helix transcriptional regulator n=1 Tax=Neisseria sp. TaxID=192066 RepID=UPI00359F8ADB
MYEQLKLNNQLCFPLYALSKEITRRYTPFLDALDLTYPQYLVMLVLWEHGGQRVSDIGAKLMLDSGTLTPLLKRLQSKGLVERSRGTDDERSVHIRLTEAGQALERRAAEVPQQLAGCLKMNAAEAEALREAVRKILENI